MVPPKGFDMKEFEVAVIGGGVMGSAAAHYLAQAGRKTVLIDQFPLPHSRGSSGGHTRITRLVNYGLPCLSPIMVEAKKGWGQLEEQCGMTLFKPAPLLVVSRGETSEFKDLKASIKLTGLKPEILPIDQVNKKYRTNFSSNYKSVVDPSAGILFADKCIKAFQRLFVKNGGEILDGWPVSSIVPGTTIEVSGPKGKKVKAKAIVICPGSWVGPLLADLGIKIPVSVQKVGVYYWKIKDKEVPKYGFINLGKGDDHFYALPDFDYRGYMKLCPHKGPVTDPNQRDKADLTATLQSTKKYIAEHFPCLEPTPSVVESCMYTVTPDEMFFLDRHPKHNNIVIAGGFSGTGFKLAPACGEALARMAMGLKPKLDFSSFNIGRFSEKKSHL